MGMDQRIFRSDRVKGAHIMTPLLEWHGLGGYLAFAEEEVAGANGSFTPVDGDELRRVAKKIELDEPELAGPLRELAAEADIEVYLYYEWDN